MYPGGYNLNMLEIRKTQVFSAWLDGLRDMQGRVIESTTNAMAIS